MKVKELIKKLEQVDPELEMMYGNDTNHVFTSNVVYITSNQKYALLCIHRNTR